MACNKQNERTNPSSFFLPPSNLLFHSVLSYPPLLFPISILASTPLGIRPQPSTSIQIHRSGSTIGCVSGTTKPDVFVFCVNERSTQGGWVGSHATRTSFTSQSSCSAHPCSTLYGTLQNRLIFLKRLEPLTSQVLLRSV